MTLPLETASVQDEYARRALDVVAQQFPVSPVNSLGGIPGSSLPTGTFNGQDFYYQVSGGGVWHFKYNTSSARWDFSGGPALVAEVATSETTASTTYTALATAGPSVTLPFAGDYQVEIGATTFNATNNPIMSYDIGGTGAVDADSFIGGTAFAAGNRVRSKTGLTAVTLTAKYKNSGATTGTFRERWMRVTPIRIG